MYQQHQSRQQQQQQRAPTAHKAPRSPSEEAFDADLLIEQLMKEAEADPGLRAMSGLGEAKSKTVTSTSSSEKRQVQQQQQQQQQQQVRRHHVDIKRPYRTQDIVIQDSGEKSRQQQQQKNIEQQQQQQWRQQQQQRQQQEDRRRQQQRRPQLNDFDSSLPPISRSKSADTRRPPQQQQPHSRPAAAASPNDPRLQNFKRSTSQENFTEEIMHEVVTDQDHHSVKDLVAMIEKNTNSESANPYVRKWGCDLISPEPHTKNVTYRRERKELVQRQQQQRQQQQQQQQRRYDSGGESDQEWGAPHQLPIIKPPATLEGDFRLSAHVADLDSILGRPATAASELSEDQDGHLRGPREVAWPPPSPTHDDHESRAPTIKRTAENGLDHQRSRSSPPPASSSLSRRPPPAAGAISPSFGKRSHDVDASLLELDKHVSSLQGSGFGSQLDSMLREKTNKQQQQQQTQVKQQQSSSSTTAAAASSSSSYSSSAAKKKGQPCVAWSHPRFSAHPD